jgi:hypothetical protein
MEINWLSVEVLLASAILALAATLGFVWLVRARAARRLQAALDIYADREMARIPGRQRLKSRQAITTRAGSW